MRSKPDYTREARCPAPVAGVDEAGRGPLAGPVVAAAVVLDPAHIPEGIDDSKRLSAARRAALAAELRTCARIGIGLATVEEIDRHNILQATLLAMTRAVANLPLRPAMVLVDGNRCPNWNHASQAIVRGDALSLSIAAASIVAKHWRDGIMAELDAAFPDYGWRTNKGYPTEVHRQALLRFGPSPHHRRSFAPVAQAVRSGV